MHNVNEASLFDKNEKKKKNERTNKLTREKLSVKRYEEMMIYPGTDVHHLAHMKALNQNNIPSFWQKHH